MELTFSSLLSKFIHKKIIYFGTGSSSERLYELLPRPTYFIDNDKTKWGKSFKTLPIYSPEKLVKENRDEIVIIVASQFFDEIANQLDRIGFTKNDHYFNGNDLCQYAHEKSQIIRLEYPVNSTPRYGFGKPPHRKLYEIIDIKRQEYETLLDSFLKYGSSLKQIPVQSATDPLLPNWNNGWLPGLDALTLYCLIAETKPKKYLEIGSGNSTKFARYAIKTEELATEMISIDPCPRAEIDRLCDKVYRKPAEDIDTDVFNQLKTGDILFVDNSHRCFMNSDVTTVFLDVLPYLEPGVLVGIHDIFLPYDYPPEWAERFYSEQYLLAMYLLTKKEAANIVLPNAFITFDKDLSHTLAPIWEEINSPVVSRGGGLFWFRT